MKIIDCHLHLNIGNDKKNAELSKPLVDFTKQGLLAEMKETNVEHAIFNTVDDVVKGFGTGNYPTPVRMKEALEFVKDSPSLHLMPGLNPNSMPENALKIAEDALKKEQIAGFKVLSGYVHFYPFDKIYHKFYNLAIKYDVPVMFHTGDVYDPIGHALSKYCHPSHLDEVAVKFPKMKMIMAHLGNPLIRDAVLVLNKNQNVYADISGFFVGNVNSSHVYESNDINFALEFLGGADSFLYGTDWPLVRMKDYAEFMQKIIPSKFHDKIFYSNAKRLFRL
ncbi:MAG: amidohydrolase family protein [Candidatus Nanoarchaeia archaeon]|jgi:hypothetical protein